MAEITFSGLASGLATDDIVSKLMALERRPLERLEADKTYESNRLKAYGQLNSRLGSLREAVSAMSLTSSVRTTKASVSSEEAFTASASGAAPGSFSIAVTQLAQVQKSVSSGYASKSDSIFGSGTVNIAGREIVIDSTNNSLQGMMAAINAVSGETGVTATLINDGSGGETAHRLILTGKDAATSFTVTSTLQNSLGEPISFNSADTFTDTQQAQKAKLLVDGIEVVSNSNSVSEVISGVTLNLTATSPVSDAGPPPVYTTSEMTVTADTDALKEKISAFVSSYNQVMEWVVAGYQDEAALSESADDEAEPAEEPLSNYLRGDATVNSVKRGLQGILTNVLGGEGSLQILSQIGISTNKDGTLKLDAEKLDNTLSEDFTAVGNLLAGDDNNEGVMKKFNSYLLQVTSGASGMYAEKRERYEAQAKRLDAQIAQKTALLDKKEASMKERFAAMELLLSSLNAQSNYLTQQMEMLSNMTTGGKRR
jgi:flagellar hook-associated protein 2